MTLENCKRLLKHFEEILDGTKAKPFGHKNWDLVMANAKEQVEVLKERIARKEKLPKYSSEEVKEIPNTLPSIAPKSKGSK